MQEEWKSTVKTKQYIRFGGRTGCREGIWYTAHWASGPRTLRLEMGYCLYGNEIDDNTSPIAAGLGWVTRPETNFLNAELLREEKLTGTTQKLVGFELIERGIPRSECLF